MRLKLQRKLLFAIASILSFIVAVFWFFLLLISSAGHPPFSQIGISILPVFALCFVLFASLGVVCWNLRYKRKFMESVTDKAPLKLIISSLFLSGMGLIIPFLGIGGIITGHIARSKYKNIRNGSGYGLVIFSLILGYLSVLYFSYAVIAVFPVGRIGGV